MKVHFVYPEGTHDALLTYPPSVGDEVVVEGRVYRVEKRRFFTDAGEEEASVLLDRGEAKWLIRHSVTLKYLTGADTWGAQKDAVEFDSEPRAWHTSRMLEEAEHLETVEL